MDRGPDSQNLIEEKVGYPLELKGTGKAILNRIPIVQSLSPTTENWDLLKLKNFYAKDNIIQVEAPCL